jgi:peptidoglycan-associated lipoprotein
MRRIKAEVTLLLTIAAAFATQVVAQSKSAPTTKKPPLPEVALEYSFLRSNAPPGECGCFNLNGGSANFAWPLKTSGFELVGEITADHSGQINAAGDGLTVSAYTGGARYLVKVKHKPGPYALQPFVETLVGVAHASGSLAAATSNAGAAFAANLGGGLDLRVNRSLSIRMLKADYLLTTFDNGGNNHQNNLRLGAGVVLRFGKS